MTFPQARLAAPDEARSAGRGMRGAELLVDRGRQLAEIRNRNTDNGKG